LVAQLSGNAALELFMDVVKMFGNRSDQMIFTADRLREYEQIIRGQAEAIAAGEVAKALALTDREVETALQWLESPRKYLTGVPWHRRRGQCCVAWSGCCSGAGLHRGGGLTSVPPIQAVAAAALESRP